MAIVVEHYCVETFEDTWGEGEASRISAYWNNGDIPVCKPFQTAPEALNAIAEANYWTADKVYWTDRHAEGVDELGTYEGSILVDADNAEADAADVEAWKQGDKRLWNAQIYVKLVWREERALTEAEAAI